MSLTSLLSLLVFSCVKAEPSVIIIGAGSSGIAAAVKLFENGFENITILEAEERLGGRIHSVEFGDALVDLGAEFCQGENGNVIFDLVKDLNILKSSNFSSKQFYSDGKEITGRMKADMEEFYSEFENNLRNIDSDGLTVGEAFLKHYNSTILPKYQSDEKMINISRDFINTFEANLICSEGAFSWFEPSAKSNYEEYKGDQTLNWNGLGYKTVLEALIKKNPIKDKTIFKKKVTKIKWNSNGISITTSDNATYSSDIAIFTPSVGVLKEHHLNLFEPHLPESKIRAIENIGFGAIQKIFLKFSDRWWNGENSVFILIWDDQDLQEYSSQFPDTPHKNGKPWISEIASLEQAPNNPNVLTAWVGGIMVPEIEKIPPELIMSGLVFIINNFFGKQYNVTKPEQIIYSSWYSNSNFKGTYSYETVKGYNAKIPCQLQLAEALNNVLYFSGEATNPTHFGTVHGAIESGFREAQRIVDFNHNSVK